MCDNKRCIICDTVFSDEEKQVCPYCGEEDPLYHVDSYEDCEDEYDEDYDEDYDNDEF